MDTINKMEDDDEEGTKLNAIISQNSTAMQLTPIYKRGNAKTGSRKPYDSYKQSKVFGNVM